MGECPTEADFNPLPIIPNASDAMKWTGFSAFWSDLMQAGSIYSVRDGGNIYFREVALEDNDWRSTRDLVMAANRLETEEYLEKAYIITFHKMADSNGKRSCGSGLSFQYTIIPRSSDNPIVLFSYGQFEWDLKSVTAGWNAYQTSSNYGFHLLLDDEDGVGDVAHLERKSFRCEGSHCEMTMCQLEIVYDNIYNDLLCEDYISTHGEADKVTGSVEFSLYLNKVCTAESINLERSELESEVSTWLEFAYHWSKVENVTLIEVNCVQHLTISTEYLIELVLEATVSISITSGHADHYETAVGYLNSTIIDKISVPIKAMRMWGNHPDWNHSWLLSHGHLVMRDLRYETIDFGVPVFRLECAWGREYVENQGCVDIDECESENINFIPCKEDNLDMCVNLDGGYTCSCEQGWESALDTELSDPAFPNRGPFMCIDVDECTENTHACSDIEVCVNELGSHRCECGENAETLVDSLGQIICAPLTDGNSLYFSTSIELIEHILINKLNFGTEYVQSRQNTTEAMLISEKIYEYGCWCPLAEGLIAHKNKPMDSIDNACRKRNHCQICFDREAPWEMDQPGCSIAIEPWYLTFHEDQEDMYKCGGEEFSCERAACACELEFALTVADLIAKGQLNEENLNVSEEKCEMIVEKAPYGYDCLSNPYVWNDFRRK